MDPEQSVMLVALFLFISAAFDLLSAVPVFLHPSSISVVAGALVFLAAEVAAGVGLLKLRRWAWPLAIVVLVVGILATLVGGAISSSLPVFVAALLSIASVGLLGLLFNGLGLYLLSRPAVRQRLRSA
jgi:hypothetical protein